LSSGTFSGGGGSAVPAQGRDRARPGRTPGRYLGFVELLCALACICAQSNREVHRAPTSPRHPCRTTESPSQAEALPGVRLCHSLRRAGLSLRDEAERATKSMRHRSMRNPDPREWAEIGRLRRQFGSHPEAALWKIGLPGRPVSTNRSAPDG
jgi:hypothetical protein